MKKKKFAALTASLMLCGMLTAPVSAAETELQMGDVNLDGVVDVSDAQLLLLDYASLMVGNEGILTAEQREIGNVDGEENPVTHSQTLSPVDVRDAQLVMSYYCIHLVKPDVTLEQVVGRELNVKESLKTFNQKYRMEYDPDTMTFKLVEKEAP